jgi:small-conductance mechanosensitive channel
MAHSPTGDDGSPPTSDAGSPPATLQMAAGPAESPAPRKNERTTTKAKKERFTTALVSGFGAVVAMSAGSTLGDVHSHVLHQKLFAYSGALAFLVLAVIAVQSTAATMTAVLRARASRSARGAIRILVAFFGYVIVFFVELGLLGVPVTHLLIGAGMAGVVLGIAAQQALGNVFAGLVLMLARPFRLDQRVRIRAGALGGIFEATIKEVSLVYVTLETDDGIVNVPNSVMLQIGVGPIPKANANGGRRR